MMNLECQFLPAGIDQPKFFNTCLKISQRQPLGVFGFVATSMISTIKSAAPSISTRTPWFAAGIGNHPCPLGFNTFIGKIEYVRFHRETRIGTGITASTHQHLSQIPALQKFPMPRTISAITAPWRKIFRGDHGHFYLAIEVSIRPRSGNSSDNAHCRKSARISISIGISMSSSSTSVVGHDWSSPVKRSIILIVLVEVIVIVIFVVGVQRVAGGEEEIP